METLVPGVVGAGVRARRIRLSASLVAVALAGLAAPGPCFASTEAADRLTTNPAEDRSPDCSPDGTRVALQSDRYGSFDLFQFDLESGELERLTADRGDEISPAWSPEGTRLVFHRTPAEGEATAAGLWILDLETRERTLLLEEASRELTPDWSPDGGWIAFGSERNGKPDLYRVRVDGSGLERLTDNPYRDAWPRYSPDDSAVLFFSRRDTEGEFDELYVMDLSGRAIRRLTHHPDHHDFAASWSPDGSRVVTGESRRAENRRDLVILDLEGEVRERFATGYHRVFQPVWCADGSIVYAARTEDGAAADLYRRLPTP